ncbi:MAG: sulfotransferase [Candidatus Thermoplasmatota archaeon]|nr:sulfotransferase [Candidatus Thermoplasmatota archaeon]
MAKQIFVLGVHRSGTKWLANILCSHSRIAGIQAERHYGIHESAFFCIVKDRFGDLQDDDNFIEFIETFSSSDYFILSNLDKTYFYKNRPRSYDEFFRMMMDKYAEEQNAEFWLEKTPAHLLYFHDLSEIFPTAKFIIIKRNIIDSIKSDIRLKYFNEHMQKKMKFSKIIFVIFLTFRYHLYYSNIYFQRQKQNYLLIEYEKLKKNRLEVTKKICNYLDIDFEQPMLEDKYKPNTLFTSEKERKEVLTKPEIIFIKIFNQVFRFLPSQFFSCFLPLYKKKFREVAGIPDWFYSIKKEEFASYRKKV